MPIVNNIYGNTSSDATSYNPGTVSPNTLVESAKWAELFNLVNLEKARRGLPAGTYTSQAGTVVTAYKLNRIIGDLEINPSSLGTFYDRYGVLTHAYYTNTSGGAVYFPVIGGYTGGIRSVAIGTNISATHLNQLITKLNGAASYCVCNCNYCTCNCNYCTCNCNYSCTCNCNYSDKRLKRNIKFLYKKNGLKIYSWQYILSNKKYEGVIAQDLLNTKYKKALTKDKDGYYMVNYSLLPIKQKEINE